MRNPPKQHAMHFFLSYGSWHIATQYKVIISHPLQPLSFKPFAFLVGPIKNDDNNLAGENEIHKTNIIIAPFFDHNFV